MAVYILIFGAFLKLLGALDYIRDTIKGKTKPNKVSWFFWTLTPIIGVSAAVSDGVTWAIVPVIMAGVSPLLVFVATFINKESYWELRKFDYWCGFFSLLALILWYLTKDPDVAITLAIIADAFASIPTFKKVWYYPKTENPSPYLASIFVSATTFLVLTNWRFSEWAFPSYLMMSGIIFVSFIWRGKFSKK